MNHRHNNKTTAEGCHTSWSAPPPRTSAPVHSLWRARRHGTSCRHIYGHQRQLAPSRRH